MRILISWDHGQVPARLFDTPGGRAVFAALPIHANASRRGGEMRVSAALGLKREAGARQVVETGTLCYWAEGASLTVPLSPGRLTRLAAPCTVLGRLEGDPAALQGVRNGHLLVLSRLAEDGNGDAAPLSAALNAPSSPASGRSLSGNP